MLPIPTHLLVTCLSELETPKALAFAIMARYSDFSGLLHVDVQPGNYIDSEKYFRDAQALALFSKYKGLTVPGVDRSTAALAAWWKAEHAC